MYHSMISCKLCGSTAVNRYLLVHIIIQIFFHDSNLLVSYVTEENDETRPRSPILKWNMVFLIFQFENYLYYDLNIIAVLKTSISSTHTLSHIHVA